MTGLQWVGVLALSGVIGFLATHAVDRAATFWAGARAMLDEPTVELAVLDTFAAITAQMPDLDDTGDRIVAVLEERVQP